VITQHLLGAREHATPRQPEAFCLCSSHLRAVHRVTLLTSYHEAGHTLVYEYGIGKTNYFQNETLANYFAHARIRRRETPHTATVEEGILNMPMPPGAHTSHREDMFKTNPANYDWYQLQFGLQAMEIYDEQGRGFLAKVKSAFPKGTPAMSVAEILSRLEAISPGFQAWAKRLSQYKSEGVPAQ